MATTLETLFSQRTTSGPYQKSIHVLVTGVHPPVEYQSDGVDKKVLNCVVADPTKTVKVAVFDQSKFGRFVRGSSIVLRNFIAKPESTTITITSKLQVFPSAPVKVEASVIDVNTRLFSPPPAEVVPISQALGSPLKTMVSIQGQIVKEEAVQQVTFKNQKVEVKNIHVKDESTPNSCRVALWREATRTEARPGDYVKITNVVINTFRNDCSNCSPWAKNGLVLGPNCFT